MPHVLLPSDHRDWVVNFADGYRRLGWDVTTGTFNFDLEASRPDILHLNWPEELTGWKVPTAAQVDAIIARLDRWAKRTRLIVSANNLYPHGQHGHPVWRRLYTAVYERADVIHHFSRASKDLVCAEYPSIAGRNHVVRVGFNYDLLLPAERCDRAATRRALGIATDELVYLVFGTLRVWDEVQLIMNSFSRAKVSKKRVFLAANFCEVGHPLRRRWHQWRLKRWLRRNNGLSTSGYVPDEEVPPLFAAADAVVVVRQSSLNSGLPSLAMTFGRMVIGPNLGGIPEYLAEAGNPLYDGTAAASLAEAMETAARLDRERIGARNREIAAGWTWDGIVKTCLDALPTRAGTNCCCVA
jgi:glycosyltransferase involved in cell wall biosynthesis